jgi:hypothetical protein
LRFGLLVCSIRLFVSLLAHLTHFRRIDMRLAYLLAPAVVLSPALAWSTAQASFVVRDTFLDGDHTTPGAPQYSEFGVDSDADGDLESAWFFGGAGAAINTTAGAMDLALAAGGTQSGSFTTYFTPEATPITLANAGDQIIVRWTFSLVNLGNANTSQDFRLALVDTPDAARLSANGAPGSAAYTGYGMFMNMGPTLGNSNPFQLRERAVASGSMLSGSADWTALANGATNGSPGYETGVDYTFEMSITRDALDQLVIDVSMAGGNLGGTGLLALSFIDATPNNGSFSFDTFSIRPSRATTTADIFRTSGFEVQFIPEPASAALVGLGMLAMGRRRR